MIWYEELILLFRDLIFLDLFKISLVLMVLAQGVTIIIRIYLSREGYRVRFFSKSTAVVIERVMLIIVLLTTIISVASLFLTISGEPTNSDSHSFVTIKREIFIVGGSLVLIGVLSAAIIYVTPSRMTVIAGISIGLIVAVLMVEAFLWANDYMKGRVHEKTDFHFEYLIPSNI